MNNKKINPRFKWIALLVIPFMAWTSRMAGGGWPKLPFGLDQWLYSLAYLALLGPIAGWYSVLGYLGAVLRKRMGHGRGMSLGEPMEPGSKPEKAEYLILWLQDKMPVYWYKALIMALVGFLGLLPAISLLAYHGEAWAALALFLGGVIGNPLAYMIGWAIFPDGGDSRFDGSILDQLNEATEIGEFLSGLFAGISVFVAAYLVYFHA